jgi:histone-lysine N-methyltransferase SETD1
MFTVDSMNVIDATHRGNKARFINHNCQVRIFQNTKIHFSLLFFLKPNCFAKTVLSGGVKHIVIYALMDITRGSELTYDYSFPEEDVKIPCHCGTTKCRIYLN